MLKHCLTACLLLLLVGSAAAQTRDEMKDGRQRGWNADETQNWLRYLGSVRYVPTADACGGVAAGSLTERRDVIMNGNKITSQITNFGSISSPGNTITDIVWNGLGYGYEFGPMVAAEIVDDYKAEGRDPDPQSVPLFDDQGNPVFDDDGDPVLVMRIVSDGLVSNGGERSPDNNTWWGWQPIPCAQPVGAFEGLPVVNPESDKIPTSDARDENLDGKPDSWPDAWYNDILGDYLWPGALRQGSSNADKEALYFMNDYNNCEFAYDPFPSDPDLNCGLGLEVEVRVYQWANPLAEDAVFLVYKITNKSERDLEKVRFGMWGDPHIGGPGDWHDDFAFYDKKLEMVYAWDADGRSDIAGRAPGYFGYKFLESPGVEDDGIDNDGDGLIDESWTDGIDNDGDWDPDKDDVGEDGIPGTGDTGEGDGVPTAGDPFDIRRPGEPNFEFTDLDESDMLGLTSFRSPPFAGNNPSNDERVWDLLAPQTFDEVPEDPGDYVFVYGSGQFRLRAGDTKRFSIALLVGESFNDLTLNARTVQQIYNAGYVFAKPPEKPTVTAVPGDQKVTLYWDRNAEASVDPLTQENDFEGYVIYRSTKPDFSDQQTITDINGSAFLYRPLETVQGVEAKFDLKNGITGPSEIVFPQRGIAYDLGDDTGLFHSFVDSNNVMNGQRYFYTVVAYDRGAVLDDGEGLPPSETTKTITYDPQTDRYTFDVNTVSVTPGPTTAGYVGPSIFGETGLQQVAGNATGDVRFRVLNEFAIEDGNPFRIEFDQVDGKTVYSVIDQKTITADAVTLVPGRAASLLKENVLNVTVTLNGQALTEGVDYEVNYTRGSVTALEGGAIPAAGADATVTFQYKPIFNSTLLAGEEANPVFDGLQLFITDDPLEVDTLQTGFAAGGEGFERWLVKKSSLGGGTSTKQPADYEIRFADSNVSVSEFTNLPLPFTIENLTFPGRPIAAVVQDVNRNGKYDFYIEGSTQETISFIEDLNGDGNFDARAEITWEVVLDFEANAGASLGSGDVFYVRTNKPFGNDVFTFTTTGATTDEALMVEELDQVYVVPNPYVATNEFEPANPVDNTARGDRRLYFANVPPQCTIRIFTLAGELVDTIEVDQPLSEGKVFWDLRTKDNMNIAYGLYFFHVETDAGTRIGKFAVIK